jgi:hypothetical protein
MIDPGLELLAKHGICPDCGNSHFLRGPSGGASDNIECGPCGSRFNIAVAQGQFLLAQRIRYTGIWPDRGDWP